MKEFRTYYNSKSMILINKIIETEELNIKLSVVNDAIGDTVIKAYGRTDEIRLLQAIFETVSQ